MTIVFETRTTKKTREGERVPLYLRLVDGRFYLSHLKTKIMVNPVIWDSGLGAIKKPSFAHISVTPMLPTRSTGA